MNTKHQHSSEAPAGCQSLTTKVVHALLALAMLAILTTLIQPAVNHIGEEIPRVNLHSAEEVAGGAAGGIVWRNRG